MNIYKRSSQKRLLELAKQFRVLVITGPRQAGKTTLAKMAFPKHAYQTLEDPDIRQWAQEDPRGFLRSHDDGLIIDEVQRVPSILSYLQSEVDSERKPGRFILTGSSNLLMHAEVSQSLAGRAFFFELTPFSLAEEKKSKIDTQDLEKAVFRGGFPEVVVEGIEPTAWYKAYIASYMERDVRQLIQIRDLSTFQRFLQLCAARTGQLWNRAAVGSDAGISAATVDAWASALEASHLVTFLRPHHNNFGKRLTKSPKFYFNDSALAVRLLGIQSAEQCRTHPLWGSLVETWVISQIRRSYLNQGEEPPMWFWRDHRGLEIDLLIERENKLYPVEIKAGETIASDWLSPIKTWQKWAQGNSGEATLIYGGYRRMTRSGAMMIPWNQVEKV